LWNHKRRLASDKTSVSGAAFLQLLSQACDKAKPEGRKLIKTLNEEKFKGGIFEFKVQMHRKMDAMHVWRGTASVFCRKVTKGRRNLWRVLGCGRHCSPGSPRHE